jgi:hypothetical protein
VLKGNPKAPKGVSVNDPGNPIATYSGGNITGAVGDGGLGAGSYYFAHSTVNVNSGDGFFVRIWNAGKDCYIDTSAQSISWGDSPLANYTLTYSSATAYWARQPGEPSIASIGESLQRKDQGTPADPDDDTYDLTLSIRPSYDQGATHIQLAETDATAVPDGAHKKFRIHCYNADDPAPPTLTTLTTDNRVAELNSGTVSFSGAGFGPGSYSINVYAFNWFGHGEASDSHSTLGGEQIPGGPYDLPLALKAGINTISLPFATDQPITLAGANIDVDENGLTVLELIEAINTAVPVTVFGWYDENEQAHRGLTSVAFDAAGAVDVDNCTAIGGTVSEILAAPIKKNHPYQTTVGADTVVVLNGRS